MLSVLVTVPGRPLNGGTVARFIAEAMHAPLDVPANGASLTVALDTLPRPKVTTIVLACQAHLFHGLRFRPQRQ